MQSEFEFIDKLKNQYGLSKIGDDAAVLPRDNATDMVISTDMLVEDIDFKLNWSKAEFIGQKSLAVSISDILAMGGKATSSLVSIGVPEKLWKTDFVKQFYDGYMRLAEKLEVELIGGDVSKTPDRLVIDSTVLGIVEKGKAILRSTAKIGDLVFVTGELGNASIGLKLLENGSRYSKSLEAWQAKAILKQLAPLPYSDRTAFKNYATSMIDLSDGLSSDLMHICKSSKVGAKIYAEKIPINPNLKQVSNANILDFALHGGEDFELLFTIKSSDLKKFKKQISDNIIHIGEITENIEKMELIRGGRCEILNPKGYIHF